MKKIQSNNKSKKTAAVILAAIALGVFATDNSVAGTGDKSRKLSVCGEPGGFGGCLSEFLCFHDWIESHGNQIH